MKKQIPPNVQVPMAFQEIFRGVVMAFQPRMLDPETIHVYWQTLGTNYPLPVIRESADILKKRQQFFPTTGEWHHVAQAVRDRQILEGRFDEVHHTCEWCGDRGLVRIMYQAKDPYDIAICSCFAARFFRQAGPAGVHQLLGLDEDHRVAHLEDFDEDEVEAPDSQLEAVTNPSGGGTAFVYAIQFGDHVKIGFSTNLRRRYLDLCTVRGRDGVFLGRASLKNVSHARLLERWLQHQFGSWRLDGEWFAADPELVSELRALLGSRERVTEELRQASNARASLSTRRPEQDNFRVIAKLAAEILKPLQPNIPPETVSGELLRRCESLQIAADEDVASRALRAASFRLKRFESGESDATRES